MIRIDTIWLATEPMDTVIAMTPTPPLDQLDTEQLRSLAAQLLQHVEHLDKEVRHHKTWNQQLTHEIALLKRHRFAKRSESFSPD